MATLFTERPFTNFGASRFQLNEVDPVVNQVEGARTSILRTRLRRRCPRCPGVYGMVATNGESIYVGKAK